MLVVPELKNASNGQIGREYAILVHCRIFPPVNARVAGKVIFRCSRIAINNLEYMGKVLVSSIQDSIAGRWAPIALNTYITPSQ